MVTINFKRLKELKEQQVSVPKPKPRVTLANASDPPDEIKPRLSVTGPLPEGDLNYVRNELDKRSRSEVKRDSTDKAWVDHYDVLIERKKLSNQIWDLVEGGASKIDLAKHYERIESFRPDLAKTFDAARHVEQYGNLPEEKKEELSTDILKLKDQKRGLINRRSKLQTKIKKGHVNPNKVIEWELELEKEDTAYNLVDEQLKRLEGKA